MPVVTGGGIIIALVFSLATGIAFLNGKIDAAVAFALLGPIAVAVIGFCDDLIPLNILLRTSGYVLSASWTMYWIGFPAIPVGSIEIQLGWVGLLFGIVSLVWMQNLYNFMDGIDGLAISQAVFVCTSVILLSSGLEFDHDWELVTLILLGACLGFLSLNLPDAKLFMGDAGSAFLGLLFGVLILANTSVSIWAWLTLLAYFITDASLTITVRLVRGDRIYVAHSLHSYQHLTRRIGKRETLVAIVLTNVVWLLPLAYIANNLPDYGFLCFLVACMPLLILQAFCGAGQIRPVWAVSIGPVFYLEPTALQKRVMLLVMDFSIISFSLWLAVILRYNDVYKDMSHFWWLFPSCSGIGVLAMYQSGAYESKARLFDMNAITPLVQAVSISAIAVSLVAYLTAAYNFPRSAPFIFWVIAILIIAASRLLIRSLFFGIFDDYVSRKPVAIYGTEASAIKKVVTYVSGKKYLPVAIINNDRWNRKGTLHGIRVYDFSHIDRLISEWGIVEFLYPEALAKSDELMELRQQLETRSMPLVCIPEVQPQVSQDAALPESGNIQTDSPPLSSRVDGFRNAIEDRRIMLIGRSPSLQAAYLPILFECQPRLLILCFESHTELAETRMVIETNHPEVSNIRYELLSIQNSGAVIDVAMKGKIELVVQFFDFTDADIAEANPVEFVQRYVCGTKKVMEQLDLPSIRDYLIVSTGNTAGESSFIHQCLKVIEMTALMNDQDSKTTRFRSIRTGVPLTPRSRWLLDLQNRLVRQSSVTVKASDILEEYRTPEELVRIALNTLTLNLDNGFYQISEPLAEDLTVRLQELVDECLQANADGDEGLLGEYRDKTRVDLNSNIAMAERFSASDSLNFIASTEPAVDVATGLFCSREVLEDYFQALVSAISNRDEPRVKYLLADCVKHMQASKHVPGISKTLRKGSNISVLKPKPSNSSEG